ncbi:TolC family protein [Sulfurimonas sp. SAG-AH-194-I05]|nr:TolC family protein [Sulfurimonas sp. SAG-AH-194-I05]MDF1875619.1 TolC family protein [Sulfurimonas sp. SAG-AH-194-I05]
MIKKISIIACFSSIIYAQSAVVNFDEFLSDTLQNSPYLKAKQLGIEKSRNQAKILTRYENPTLELEISQFKLDIGTNNNGYRVALSQPLLLWGVGKDKKNLGDALTSKSEANTVLSRAELEKNISLLFTQYAQSKALLFLGEEELRIAFRIYEIAQARYDAGTISRGELLQAKVDQEMVRISLDSRELNAQEEYFTLLQIAGLRQEIHLSYKKDFDIEKNRVLENHPKTLYMNKEKLEYLAQIEVDSNTINSIDLIGAFEKESNQDILRLGVAIPLAVFNTKKEEVRIAKLQAQQIELLQSQFSSKMRLELLHLQKQRILLQNIYKNSEETLETQVKLLGMFQESYTIANTNLLALQNIKNQVISTKESRIQTKISLDVNAILTNYILGAYNE